MADLTPEGLCNMALRRIGYGTPIGYLLEGSPAARAAVEVYGQTRDDLLRGSDWDFARQAAGLALLKTAPVGGYGYLNPWTNAYPPPPYRYEYAYPTNALLVRSVRPTPILMPEFDPQPNVFVVADDSSVTPSKVILTNLVNAQAVYTGQIIDPTQWNASFVEAMVDSLATLLQQALGPNPDADKERMEQEAQAIGIAVGRRG
jgi:hypothetical protein